MKRRCVHNIAIGGCGVYFVVAEVISIASVVRFTAIALFRAVVSA